VWEVWAKVGRELRWEVSSGGQMDCELRWGMSRDVSSGGNGM